MKKITLFLIAILFVAAGFSQNKAVTLNSTKYYYSYTGSSTDVVSNTDTMWYATVLVNKAEPVKYSINVALDKESGTPTIYAVLKARVFTTDSWSILDTISWAGAADTVFTFTQVSTAQYYRQFGLFIDAGTTTQEASINTIKFKFWDK